MKNTEVHPVIGWIIKKMEGGQERLDLKTKQDYKITIVRRQDGALYVSTESGRPLPFAIYQDLKMVYFGTQGAKGAPVSFAESKTNEILIGFFNDLLRLIEESDEIGGHISSP